MDDNKKIMLQKIKDYKNQLVLVITKVYKLIGFYEDDEDYYYKIKTLHGEMEYHTGCGGFITLKDKLEKEDYLQLEEMFKLNDLSKFKKTRSK